MIKTKRVYEPPNKEDGYRVLVDRIWPRGLAKDRACVDLWLKEAAPSTGLRRWFRHDPKRWNEFTKRYFKELEQHSDLVRDLKSRARRGPVTLLYAAKDEEHNNAVCLRDYLGR